VGTGSILAACAAGVALAATGCGDECAAGVVCVEAFPYHGEATGPTSYRVDVDAPGFLAVELVDGAGELVLASGRDDGATALDTGTRAGAAVEPGTYWVTADLAEPYALRIHLTTAATLAAHGLAADPAGDAVRAFAAAWQRRDTRRFEYAITDFSLHSSIPRQWIVDLAADELLWNLHVAHGRGSTDGVDLGRAVTFSNIPESHQSSLGLVRTAERYDGDYGRSFRLDGLEPGFNDNVRDRAIVMHPWEGSRPEAVAADGMAAVTWGCPAVDDRIAPSVVERIADGVVMLFWYPDATWRPASSYLR
jgi:hypothetical protein